MMSHISSNPSLCLSRVSLGHLITVSKQESLSEVSRYCIRFIFMVFIQTVQTPEIISSSSIGTPFLKAHEEHNNFNINDSFNVGAGCRC